MTVMVTVAAAVTFDSDSNRANDMGSDSYFPCGVLYFYIATLRYGYIQSFQLTLSVQSMKLKDKTESLRMIFMNIFIKISHAWRK